MRKKKEKENITVSLQTKITTELRNVSEKTGIRINFIIEKAVEEYLAKYNLLGEPGDKTG